MMRWKTTTTNSKLARCDEDDILGSRAEGAKTNVNINENLNFVT